MAIASFLFIWAFLSSASRAGAGHYAGSVMLVLIAQVIDIVFGGLMLWYVVRSRREVEYMQLWRFVFACLAVSLLVNAFSGTPQVIQVFTSASFQIAHMLILLAIADVVTHGSPFRYSIYIISEILYAVADWSMHMLVVEGGFVGVDDRMTATLLFAVAVIIAFFLPTRTLGANYLLSDVNRRISVEGESSELALNYGMVASRFSLSKREEEIMLHLCQGRTRPYIAESLFLSENTVRSYTKSMYRKLDVHSKQELIDLVQRERV